VICVSKEKAISLFALLFLVKNLKHKKEKQNLKFYFVISNNSFIFEIEKNVFFFLENFFSQTALVVEKKFFKNATEGNSLIQKFFKKVE
jgi:hypothetical protein